MFYLHKANCQYNQLISNGDLFHRVPTENKENLPAIIAGKANHSTTMIAAFNKRQAIDAGDDRRRQTVALDKPRRWSPGPAMNAGDDRRRETRYIHLHGEQPRQRRSPDDDRRTKTAA